MALIAELKEKNRNNIIDFKNKLASIQNSVHMHLLSTISNNFAQKNRYIPSFKSKNTTNS